MSAAKLTVEDLGNFVEETLDGWAVPNGGPRLQVDAWLKDEVAVKFRAQEFTLTITEESA